MTNTNPRGRPKRYDRENALDQITEVFWKHGFAATSLDMISAASEMKRPSLYAAFGDKRAMFFQAESRFVEKLSSQVAEILQQPQPLAPILRASFGYLIEIYTTGQDQQQGCFLVSVGLVEADAGNEMGGLIRETIERAEVEMQACLDRATSCGYLSSDKDTAAMASILVALGHSIAVRARSGIAPSSLRQLVDQTVDLLLQ